MPDEPAKVKKPQLTVFMSIVKTSKGNYKAKLEMRSMRDGKPVVQEYYSDPSTSPTDLVKKMDTSLIGAFFAVAFRDIEPSLVPDDWRPITSQGVKGPSPYRKET